MEEPRLVGDEQWQINGQTKSIHITDTYITYVGSEKTAIAQGEENSVTLAAEQLETTTRQKKTERLLQQEAGSPSTSVPTKEGTRPTTRGASEPEKTQKPSNTTTRRAM